MADLDVFSDESFDARRWVNTILAQPSAKPLTDAKPGGALSRAVVEQKAGELVLKLQHLMHAVSATLDDATSHAVKQMPRVLIAADQMHREAVTLRQRMGDVQQELDDAERETGSAMHRICALDAVKDRLDKARSVLVEADHWDVLVDRANEAISTRNAPAAATAVAGLIKSMALLSMANETEHREERSATLATLVDRTEGVIAPELLQAMSAHTLADSVALLDSLNAIGLQSRSAHYYFASHAQQRTGSSLFARGVDDCAHAFSEIARLLRSEVSWCTRLGEHMGAEHSPGLLVSELAVRLFDSGAPVFLESLSSLTGTALLTALADGQREVQLFVSTVSSIEGLDVARVHKAAVRLFAHALRHQYASAEGAELAQTVADVRLEDMGQMDTVRLMGGSVSRVFAGAHAAVTRSLTFSQGLLVAALAVQLDTVLEGYLTRLDQMLASMQRQHSRDQATASDPWIDFHDAVRVVSVANDVTRRSSALASLLVDTGASALADATAASSRQVLHSDTESFYRYVDDASEHHRLKSFVDAGVTGALPQTTARAVRLAQVAQSHALLCAVGPVLVDLATMANEPCWAVKGDAAAPLFSLSPREPVTRMGEHLLMLPTQLESVGDTLPMLAVTLPCDEGPEAAWLAAVTREATDAFVNACAAIPLLEDHGAAQLKSDMDYLSNVLAAMSIDVSRVFVAWRDLCTAPASQIKSAAESTDQEERSVALLLVAKRHL